MKKLFVMLAALALLSFSLTACSSGGDAETDTPAETTGTTAGADGE